MINTNGLRRISGHRQSAGNRTPKMTEQIIACFHKVLQFDVLRTVARNYPSTYGVSISA